jgi:hypothetical protein
VLRRYVLPCIVILVVAASAGGLAFARESGSIYQTSCVFQVVVRLSREPPTTPEHEQFIASLALEQVSTAIASGLYGRVGTATKLNPGAVNAKTLTRPAPGLGAFVVTVSDDDAVRAVRLANSVCDEFVATIKRLRRDAVDAQVKEIQDRIASIQSDLKGLQKVPVKKRTTTQTALITGLQGAVLFNSQLISNVVSLPPDDISVLSRAASVEKKQAGNLSKDMIVAGVGGLLACFLYILVGEVLAERKRSLAPPSLRDEEPVLSGRR